MQENTPDSRTAPTDLVDTVIPWLLGIILVFAPLYRSGQPALAVLVLELLAVTLLVLILWQPRRNPIHWTQTLALVLLIAFPLLYLVPLPADLAAWLPGRDLYLIGQELLAGPEPSSYTLSLHPLETESSWLLLLVPVAVFLGTRTLDTPRLTRLVQLLLLLACMQSLLGLLQYGASAGSPLLLGMEVADFSSAKGTYTNRNHLAGLLEMVLPIALALTIFSVRGQRPNRIHQDKRRPMAGRLVFFASPRGHAAITYGLVTLLLLIGLVFTRSRSGILLGMLAVLLSTMVFARRIGGTNVYGTMGALVAIATGIGITIGLVPVLDRFSVGSTITDARWTIYSSTLEGIGIFFPLGSGPGNYPDVFPSLQPVELGRWFINHAHNDYLEWLFEGGLLIAALILYLLILYIHQWTRVYSRGEWSRIRFIQVAAGIAMLLLLLHSLTDFNLHIPANIAYFAFLTGVFFTEPNDGEASRGKRRRTLRLEETPRDEPKNAPVLDQIKNPFLD